MKNSFLTLLFMLFLAQLKSQTTQDYLDYIYGRRKVKVDEWFWRFDIRSTPALGFFPLGGDTFDNISLSTFICGPSLDIYGREVRGEKLSNRLAFLNFSAYLVGLNYAALDPQSEASIFQIGYARIGPHYRFDGYGDYGKFAIGTQFGYGFLLEGNSATAKSKIQHGLEISFTFSWTPMIVNHR
jgi:hypothetical protein